MVPPDGIVDIDDVIFVAIHFGKLYASSSSSSSSSVSNADGTSIEGTTRISLYPDEITVNKNETFSVNVTIHDVSRLYGWEFKLRWNNTILNCTGAQVHAPDVWHENHFEAGPGIEVYNATQRYFKAMSALYPAPSFNGSMVVVTLTFQAKSAGTTSLRLEDTKLVDSNTEKISHAVFDAYVTVLPPLTVLAGDQHGDPVADGDVYLDGQLAGYTGSTFFVQAGVHEVFVNDFWEAGETGYRYGFTGWEDDSTGNPRSVTVEGDTTITAHFDKKWCPGDVNGDGLVDIDDITIVNVAFAATRDLGDPWPPNGDWDSRADLNRDNLIDIDDMTIVNNNYGNIYP
jgi:hypothetical protein